MNVIIERDGEEDIRFDGVEGIAGAIINNYIDEEGDKAISGSALVIGNLTMFERAVMASILLNEVKEQLNRDGAVDLLTGSPHHGAGPAGD